MRISLRQRAKVLADELSSFYRERQNAAPRVNPLDQKSSHRGTVYERETAAIFQRRFAKRIDAFVEECGSYGARDSLVDQMLRELVPGHYPMLAERLPLLADQVP